MNLREFLRGGYQTLDDITVVSNHGRPVFTVHPHTGAPPEEVAQPLRERPVTAVPKNGSARTRTRRT